jgi:hypothetical protein
MSYSLVSAAAACGINRSTVLRAIKAGKILAQRDAQAAWEIVPAELHRVFPPVATANGGDAPGNTGETALLRTVVDDLGAQVEDLKIDRDRWHEAYVATQRMLPSPLPEPYPSQRPCPSLALATAAAGRGVCRDRRDSSES